MINPTASIAARFHRVGEQTHLAEGVWHAPLKIAKTFPQEDGGLHVCSMDCSPGMLAGDRYHLDWRADEGARVLLTNQSFTRVHPSNGRPCALEQTVRVAAGARLELFPEPVMLFAGAALEANTEVEIEPGGRFLFSEILCAGRVQRGEAFAFEVYRGKLNIRYGGRAAFVSQVQFSPASQPLRVTASWADYTHWGMFGAFGEGDMVVLREALHEVLNHHEAVLSGVSLAARHGVTVSMFGRRAQDLQALVEALRYASQGQSA